MLVKNWMRRNPIIVELETGVKSAFLLMKKHRIRQLPVVRDGVLIGIVTDRDFRKTELLHRFYTADEVYRLEDRFAVGDIMTMEVTTVTENTSIEEGARLLLEYKINGLPVISENGRLIGIITTSDISGAFLRLYKSEN